MLMVCFVVAITTPANGDERQHVLPMLAQIRLATGKPGNPKRRPKTLAALHLAQKIIILPCISGT